MAQIEAARYPIVGDIRVKGCLMGVELVKDRTTKEPFDEAGKLVYQTAFRKGLAWIPAGHILRMSPPIIMPDEVAQKGDGHHRRVDRRSVGKIWISGKSRQDQQLKTKRERTSSTLIPKVSSRFVARPKFRQHAVRR